MNNNLIKSFIIHARKYRETSMIYDVLTEEQGLISILAKGIKSKKDGFILQPFRELQLSYTERTLPLLTKYEIVSSYLEASNKFMLESLYFNELIYRFIPKNEPLLTLYNLYKEHLNYMNTTSDKRLIVLLRFEIIFLREIGYELHISYPPDYIIDEKNFFYYDYESGFKEVTKNTQHSDVISGSSLKRLLNNELALILEKKVLRNIIRDIFRKLAGTRSIKSYDILD